MYDDSIAINVRGQNGHRRSVCGTVRPAFSSLLLHLLPPLLLIAGIMVVLVGMAGGAPVVLAPAVTAEAPYGAGPTVYGDSEWLQKYGAHHDKSIIQAAAAQGARDSNNRVQINQEVYTWTDRVYITIISPDHNFDTKAVDTIGTTKWDGVKITTREGTLDSYKLTESGPNTGIFIGEVTLIGFDHNADGNTRTGFGAAGYDNPQRETGGAGPANGYLAASNDDAISVSFDYSEDLSIVNSAPIVWGMGTVEWMDSVYSPGDTAVVRVVDRDMNLNPGGVNNFDIDVWSDSDPGGISLTVTEIGEAAGVFEGTVYLTDTSESSGHRLYVTEGDAITAEYEDNTLPNPYSTSDDLNIKATSMIGTELPPLGRVTVSDFSIADAFGRGLGGGLTTGQQSQAIAMLTNEQTKPQSFAYLVQVEDADGITVSLSWVTGTLSAGQSLNISTSWIPDNAGAHSITAFVWESIRTPAALAPTTKIMVTVN